MIPKFRAWHKKEKRMYEVITVAYDYRGTGKLAEVDCLNPLGAEHDALEFRANEIELLQWTGLNDKEGTEIYNLDILKLNDFDLLVVYRFGGYDLTCINPQTWSSPYFYGWKDKLERVCSLFEYKDPIHIKPVVLEVLPELGVLNNFVNPELLERE